jgi:single-strand DNA-binding protein
MSGVNKAILVGRLGNDPTIYNTQNGRMARLSVATSETWKDKTTGENKEKTEWHNVLITNQMLVDLTEKNLKKGNLVYVEGKIQTQKYTKDGTEKETTNVLISPFDGQLIIMERKS